MNRRSFLTTAGLTISVPIVGCVQAPGTEGTQPKETTDPGTQTTDSEGTHDLFVENYTEDTLTADIRVTRDDGNVLVEGRYELPNQRGIEFDDLAAWERSYTVNVAVTPADETTFEWKTSKCGPGSETPGSGGSRAATVRIEGSSGEDGKYDISLLVDQCDALYGPGLPTGPAEGFRLDN